MVLTGLKMREVFSQPKREMSSVFDLHPYAFLKDFSSSG